jgi:hypothetical protein
MIHKLKLKQTRMEWRLKFKIPHFITNLMEGEPHLILAGGSLASALNDLPSEDYDLWYIGDENWDTVVQRLRVKGILNQCSLINQYLCATFRHAVNEKIKIQLIQIEGVKSIEGILDHFDLVPCRIATDGEDNVYSEKRTLKSILKKEIEFNKVEYPLVAFKRFLKYHDKGYTCSDENMRKFLEQVHVRLLTHNLADPDSTESSVWREYLKPNGTEIG